MPRGKKKKQIVIKGAIPSGVKMRKDVVHLRHTIFKVTDKAQPEGRTAKRFRLHLPLWVMEEYFPKDEPFHPVRLSLYRRSDGKCGIEILPLLGDDKCEKSKISSKMELIKRGL